MRPRIYRIMAAFRDSINVMELKEIKLAGKKFTWTNNRTHTRIDRAFCSIEWETMLPECFLQTGSSASSDHCPIILVGDVMRNTYRGFIFESFWTKLQGYNEVVAEAWNQPTGVYNAFLNLHIKMQRTGKKLKQWARTKIGRNRVQMQAAKKLISILETVQEHRQLSVDEIQLKQDLKQKVLGYAAIEKLRARQQSRITWIKACDASSKLFFLSVNGRRRKKHIQCLQTAEGQLHTHHQKAQAIYEHFNSIVGQRRERHQSLNWEKIGLRRHDLHHLEAPFTEEEVKGAVLAMPSEKAPGPDGYIGAFFKSCWDLIKQDVLAAITFFFNQHSQQLNLLNSGHIVMIPKHAEAKVIGDYRPISLTHSIAKLISKLLANRLAGCLEQIMSKSQSAFIKRRCIHDNFLFTQNLIRELQRSKKPTLFIKLDIAKAFDTVRWDYLMEVMQQLGFGIKWREWVSALLATSSSSVLLNGTRGRSFKHKTGVRQGDPLSPMLFIIAFDPLQRLL